MLWGQGAQEIIGVESCGMNVFNPFVNLLKVLHRLKIIDAWLLNWLKWSVPWRLARHQDSMLQEPINV